MKCIGGHITFKAHQSVYLHPIPLIVVPRLDDPTCVIALPLSPTLVFFATHQLKVAEKITSIPISRLARAVNQETVRLANQFIFSKDQSQANFINRNFAKPN